MDWYLRPNYGAGSEVMSLNDGLGGVVGIGSKWVEDLTFRARGGRGTAEESKA